MIKERNTNKRMVETLERIESICNTSIITVSTILALLLAFYMFSQYRDATVLLLIGSSTFVGLITFLKKKHIILGCVALLVTLLLCLFVSGLSNSMINLELIIFPIIIYSICLYDSIRLRETEMMILFLSQIVSLMLLILGVM